MIYGHFWGTPSLPEPVLRGKLDRLGRQVALRSYRGEGRRREGENPLSFKIGLLGSSYSLVIPSFGAASFLFGVTSERAEKVEEREKKNRKNPRKLWIKHVNEFSMDVLKHK